MIVSLRVRGPIKRVGFDTILYNQARVDGVGSSNAGKHFFSCQKKIFLHMRSLCTSELLNNCWMAVRWESLYSSSVGLHIAALIPIWQYFSWFYFLQSEWNIESENLPDKVTNLGIFTIWLALSGCRPHTSSVWPWSGTPKVHLYNTFLGGLRQDRARHGWPPAAMVRITRTMTEDRIVSLAPLNNSTKPSAGGITNKP
jgi:hypothetical protein